MARLTVEQWQAIRTSWEYDPDEPSYQQAADRAGKKFQFQPPRKQTVADRAKAEGWERRGSMAGINAAAQRRADQLGSTGSVKSDEDLIRHGHPDALSSSKADGNRQPSSPDPAFAQSVRSSAEDLRAEINVRHRQEWKNVAVIRNEGLGMRQTDPVRCSERLRQAKLAAEITALQQAGERKAWGMEVLLDVPDLEKLSDEALEAIAKGRTPKRMS